MSNFPMPREGFHEKSAFVNFQYLLLARKRNEIPVDIRRSFPWVLSILWKNRNKFLFEGKLYLASETIGKIKSDSDQWFFAQSLERSGEARGEISSANVKINWRPPAKDWLKCNIDVSWDKRLKEVGGSWVLRDAEANVKMHSRRSFVEAVTLENAKMICLIWAIESRHSLNCNRVIFAIEAVDLVGATRRPKAWPSFSLQVAIILEALHNCFGLGFGKCF